MSGRDKDELLRRAEEALRACRAVLRGFREGPGGDHFVWDGSMNNVEEAREQMEHFVGYKITGQK